MARDEEGEGRPVEGEVVGGAPKSPSPSPESKSFFHPLSGSVILAVDWLAFGLEWGTGFTLTAVACVAAFVVTFAAVSNIQRKLSGDSPKAAAWKALAGALAAGVPFPITGTAVGALIIALSGLKTGKK